MGKSNLVGQMLVDSLLKLANQNDEYTKKRDTAKTTLKRDYYNKKIKKNSEKAERLILGLNKLNQRNTAVPDITTEEPNGETIPNI